jgi:UDP-arabinose 4-epimerase
MKNVLVTGGAGYIGSHTCKLLFESGFNPVTYDNLSTGHRDFVKWGPLVYGDIRDKLNVQETLNSYQPISVIHFAANALVEESHQDPLKYYLNNVAGTLSLIDAMDRTGIKNLVFSSSCATYGPSQSKNIAESTKMFPINPYGESKAMVEKILSDLSDREKIRFVSLRYFNAAGADPDQIIGENHIPETHLIPLAIFSGMGGKKLRLFGNNFETYDGSAVRDYVHVVDLAYGHLAALKYLIEGGKSDFINLGTGKGTSVFTIISELKNLHVNVSFELSKRRTGDPAYLVANIDKAKNILRWSPQFENISEILKTAVNWHKKDLRES